MGQISDRVEGTVDKWRTKYGGVLGEFLGGVISKGGQKLGTDLEPEIKDLMRNTLEKIRDNPKAPPELKEALNNALGRADVTATLSGWFWYVIGWIPAILSSGAVQAKLVQYDVDSIIKSYRLDPLSLITASRRDPAKAALYLQDLADLGISMDRYNLMKIGTEPRLDPQSVLTAWRRDKASNEKLFQDLKDQGWSPDRIETLKYITEIIPGVQDLVRMSVREAFSPEIAEKFGQYQDPPTAVYPWAEKQGLSKDWVDRYWAAHWELPGATQGFEMLHRGVIDQPTLELLLRALDVMPFWREKLIDISWNIPTRVDVRRFWEMRTIDESRLREVYTAMGYHGRDLEDYVLWTKIYVDFPTLLARYKNGWITLDDVRREVIAMGMTPAQADIMIEEKIKKEAPERTATEKDLTKTDIINGVKKGVITRVQGAELLIDLGYDIDEATYLLVVNIPVDTEDVVVKERELTKSEVMKGLELKTITTDQARDMLIALRYTPVNADFILDLYKTRARELEKADIQLAFKNEAITEAEAIERLVALGYTEGDARILITQKVEPVKETQAKEASKADIVAGVKKGLITPEQGYTMLVDIGYSSDAATFILSLTAESSPFSPMSYEEFKDVTQKYRAATGKGGVPMTEELKKAADELVKMQRDVDALRSAVDAERKKLIPGEELPAEATARLKDVQVKLHRAESELARVKSNYDRLVAEWRHST